MSLDLCCKIHSLCILRNTLFQLHHLRHMVTGLGRPARRRTAQAMHTGPVSTHTHSPGCASTVLPGPPAVKPCSGGPNDQNEVRPQGGQPARACRRSGSNRDYESKSWFLRRGGFIGGGRMLHHPPARQRRHGGWISARFSAHFCGPVPPRSLTWAPRLSVFVRRLCRPDG